MMDRNAILTVESALGLALALPAPAGGMARYHGSMHDGKMHSVLAGTNSRPAGPNDVRPTSTRCTGRSATG
jgi:hypothetical protein